MWQAEPSADHTSQEAMGPQTPKSVLIVDDDPQILRLLGKALSTAGYAVLEASDGRRALECVRSAPVDVMVTDLVMPDQEGIETIAAVRRERKQVKIVAMSGAACGKYLRICQLMGADAVLQKPFPPQDLLSTIEHLIS